MTSLLPFIPQSLIGLMGIAVLLGIFIMGGTFFQEWAKSIYRKLNGRNGHKNLEEAITHLIQTMENNSVELRKWQDKFQARLNEAHDTLDDIHRKQDKNWNRLFDEELKDTCRIKHGDWFGAL